MNYCLYQAYQTFVRFPPPFDRQSSQPASFFPSLSHRLSLLFLSPAYLVSPLLAYRPLSIHPLAGIVEAGRACLFFSHVPIVAFQGQSAGTFLGTAWWIARLGSDML